MANGEKIRNFENGPMECWTVTFSPDGKHIISGSQMGKITYFNVETGQRELQLDLRGKHTLSVAPVISILFIEFVLILNESFHFYSLQMVNT